MASTFIVGSSALPSYTSTSTQSEARAILADHTKSIKERVSTFYKEDPVLVKIAKCESRFRQYDSDGSILRGEVNPSDYGVMQINIDYHGARSKKLGMDLTTLEGNLEYAKHLYDEQGTAPWNASKPCWQNEVAVN